MKYVITSEEMMNEFVSDSIELSRLKERKQSLKNHESLIQREIVDTNIEINTKVKSMEKKFSKMEED